MRIEKAFCAGRRQLSLAPNFSISESRAFIGSRGTGAVANLLSDKFRTHVEGVCCICTAVNLRNYVGTLPVCLGLKSSDINPGR